MTERILGLDIGIASVGWAVVAYDSENEENNKIIDCGVRIFTQAEHPKTGESLALPRRLSRGTRRTLSRKRKRMRDIKLLLGKYLHISYGRLIGDIGTIYHDKGRKEIWTLRDEVLKRKLTDDEFARVLTHIGKRRGYKSNRKSEEKEDSKGRKVLGAISKNQDLLEQYETIGQAIYQTTKIGEKRRNKDGDYKFSVSRDMLEDEVKIIFEKQRFYKNDKAIKEFEDMYIKTFLRQLDFASVDHMVGKCTFEKKEKRAAKQSFSAEEFVSLIEIINNKMIDQDGREFSFDEKQVDELLSICKQNKSVTFNRIRKILGIESSTLFKRVAYHDKNGEILEMKEAEKQKLKNGFEKGFHALKKVVETSLSKTHWHTISQDRNLLNEIGKVFSYHKNDTKIREELTKVFENDNILNADEKTIMIEAFIENISFDGFIHLSIKAVEKINPYMKKGLTYDKACVTVGYENSKGSRQKYLRPLNRDENNELTNSVVKRAFAQTRKVVNAVIARHGQLDKVHIELTREIKKSFPDRKKIKDKQDKYKTSKTKIVEEFESLFGRKPRGNEFLKFRLYKEQGHYCFYHHKMFDIKKLLDIGYVEIDHILPFSRSLDDSMSNKILCFTKENQDKKNQTPFEYFIKEGRDWHEFEEIVKGASTLSYTKRKKLLKKNFDENSENDFKERNKNDTSFMSKFIKNFIENNLELKTKGKQNVFTRNGSLTALLRHNWGLSKKNRDNHLHHAHDATIVAFATQAQVQKLSTVSSQNEGLIYKQVEEKSKKIRFSPPIKNFRDEIEKFASEIFVSFSPRKKIKGEAHEQTIYSPNDFKANRKKEKPTFLTGGSTIRNVKLNHGTKLAKQSSMPRVDIFRDKNNGKFYVVPIYVADFVKDKLPNKAIVQGKNKDGTPKEWIEMDENYEFLFSLYKNELVEIKTKKTTTKESKILKGYFVSVHSGTGKITMKNHNNIENQFFKRDSSNVCIFSTGIQNANYIKKYHVGILGNVYEIKSEKRLGTKRST